jgi:MFS superfamily sulfate permease-like transporter
MARSGRQSNWVKILTQIQTPLGFYVLALLIVESTLAIVLTAANFDQTYKWYGFLAIIAVFVGVVFVVTILTACAPKNLLYGKEEHSAPQTDPSALRDQIEDIVYQRVKPEALKKEDEGV